MPILYIFSLSDSIVIDDKVRKKIKYKIPKAKHISAHLQNTPTWGNR